MNPSPPATAARRKKETMKLFNERHPNDEAQLRSEAE
jgi:hypothetical protein